MGHPKRGHGPGRRRGRARDYEHGSIYWTPQTGAREAHGAIRELWASMGFERSKLRYPVSDEMNMPGGRLSRFEGGEIRWTPTGGPIAVLISGFGDDHVGIPADDWVCQRVALRGQVAALRCGSRLRVSSGRSRISDMTSASIRRRCASVSVVRR
jgi:LGFP repeat-containing protein